MASWVELRDLGLVLIDVDDDAASLVLSRIFEHELVLAIQLRCFVTGQF